MAALNQDGFLFKNGLKTILLMSFILLFNVSCGKKGPLYLPKKNKQTEQKVETKTDEQVVPDSTGQQTK